MPRRSWRWIARYLPFVGLILGYLALRHTLFGNFVREDVTPLQILLRDALLVQEKHAELLLFGYFASDGLAPLLREAIRVIVALAILGLAVVPSVMLLLNRPAGQPGGLGG